MSSGAICLVVLFVYRCYLSRGAIGSIGSICAVGSLGAN